MVYGPAGARGRADDLLATWVATRLAGSRGCHGVRGDVDILLYTTDHRPPVQTVYEPRVTMTDRWHSLRANHDLEQIGPSQARSGHNCESFLKSSALRATCRGGGRMARTTRARAPADDGAARARVPPGHFHPSLGRAGDASESRRPSLSRLRAARPGPVGPDRRGFRATPGQASGRTCPDWDRSARW